MRRLGLAIGFLAWLTVGCGQAETPIDAPSEFPSCDSGATSVISFLQRTLDDIGDADAAELSAYEDRFDFGVNGLLQRAQEMHCTEIGFNQAVIARIGELEPNGPFGEALVDRVREIGLGSLDAARGGPLTLPGG